MYQKYRDACDEVLSLLSCKSSTIRNQSEKSSRMFLEHLAYLGIPYTAENAAEWLNNMKTKLSQNYFSMVRRCQYLIAEQAFKCKTQYHIPLFYESAIPNYVVTPSWSETIESFMSETEWKTPTYWVRYKSMILKFASEITTLGASGPTDVTWDKMLRYKEFTSKTHSAISAFMKYLVDRKQIWPYVRVLYNHEADRLDLYKGKSPSAVPSYSAYEVINAQKMLLDDMKRKGYSPEALENTEIATNGFAIFLLINETGYSSESQDAYLRLYKTEINSNDHILIRSLKCLEVYINGKQFQDIPACFTAPSSPSYPEWFASYAEAFLKYRELNHIGETGRRSDKAALIRLGRFLSDNGCNSILEMSRELLKKFSLSDRHATAAGKNLYTNRIRSFITFLYNSKHIPEDIGDAISIACGTKVRPTKTLNDEQYASVLNYCSKAESEGNYMDSAILKIALWTGLRAIDICKLRAEEIDWDNMEFSLIQKKTRVHIRIPFPVDVGNAIWMYIQKCRPKEAPPGEIFCHNKAPFRPLESGSAAYILEKALPGENVTFHMLRKTFATRLLRSGSTVAEVSDAIGHRTDEGVDAYIDTNCEMMRLCAISLKGIEYTGDEI